MKYYIGADLGTSSLKLLLVDLKGNILKEVSREYDVSFPKPAWSEQNPEDWWDAFVSGIKELTLGINPKDVGGIGVGGQMHGLVALDKQDRVIRPAILWNDGRTSSEVEFLNGEIGEETLYKLTANIAFAGFTAPKILWMKNNEKENFEQISKIMLPKDYLNYRLTGTFCTDYSDAAGMLLLDVKNKVWSSEMLENCGISEQLLPKLFESFEVVGTLLPEVAETLGLSKETVVVAGAGDNAAAAVGTGAVLNGSCNISLGTSGTVFISSDKFAEGVNPAIHNFCHASGKWHLMACILSAASCNKWFCEDILRSTDYEAEQKGITDDKLGNNDLFFLPYLMGERSPINDTDARGTFIGLRMDTKRADMVQAVLEGVAFAIRDSIEIARAQGVEIEKSTICGGGAKSVLWQKILCNVLNMKLSTVQTEQGPAYGGAMLAMVGAGQFNSVEACAEKFVKTKGEMFPDPEISARYDEKYSKFSKIYPTIKNLFKEIK